MIFLVTFFVTNTFNFDFSRGMFKGIRLNDNLIHVT